MAVAHANCTCEKCGKRFEVVVKRPNRRDADSFEVWAERNITLCHECVRDEIEEEHLREAEDAKKKADERGLPHLRGSEKQIRWALVIREEKIGEIGRVICGLKRLAATNEERQILADFKMCADKLFLETSASYWIESRNLEAVELVKDYHKTMLAKMK